MKPPNVYELTIPSAHRSSKTTAMVHSMGFPFFEGYCSATQIGSFHGSCQGTPSTAEPADRSWRRVEMLLDATQP
jgi:hypothetical protein